jgi:hypothetical protein
MKIYQKKFSQNSWIKSKKKKKKYLTKKKKSPKKKKLKNDAIFRPFLWKIKIKTDI